MEAQEWMDLFRMAEVHQILPMIYEAVYQKPGRRAGGSADTGSGKGADGAHSDRADAEDGRV